MSTVLFTSTYTQPYLSGITDYIAQITEFLAQKHQVTLMSFQHDTSLPLRENKNGVIQHRIPAQWRISKGFINWQFPQIMWNAVQKHEHIYLNLPQVESWITALIAKIQHKPLTVIYHCELYFEHGLVSRIIALVANILAFITCLLADTIVAYTQDYARHSAVLRFFSQKIVVLVPPVPLTQTDNEYAQKLRKQLQHAVPVIGFSGRVSREKGLLYACEAIEKLRSTYPHIQMVCAGPYGAEVAGEADYFQKLQTYIHERNLPVHFLGRLPKSSLIAFYQRIDVLVLPSTNKTEAFGLVQVESLRQGTPVIASDLPGVRVPTQLVDGGRRVAPKHSDQLAEAIQDIVSTITPVEKNAISKRARKEFDPHRTLSWYDLHCKTK